MTHEMMSSLFELLMVSAAGLGFAGVVLAGIYDLMAAARRPGLAATARRLRRKAAQPSVTVLVYAYNNAETIIDCLESIRRSRYRRYDIVVIDNVSSDDTRKMVRSYRRKYPQLPLYLYAKRKRSDPIEALRHAYQKSQKGEVVVTLTTESRPPRSLIREVAARFAAEPGLTGISLNEQAEGPLDIAGIIPVVVRATRNVIAKGTCLLEVRREQAAPNGAYRYAAITSGAKISVCYEASLLLPVANRHPSQTSGVYSHRTRIVLAVVVLLGMSYAMITAASLVSPRPLLLGWTLVVVGSLAASWSEESFSLMQKLHLTFASPLIYFLLYAALLGLLLEQMANHLLVLPKAIRLGPIRHYSRRTIS